MGTQSRAAGPPIGYSLLTAAGALGADLRPALRVLMLMQDTRKDIAAWLRERARQGDRAVGIYIEMSGRQPWDDYALRCEVGKLLDEYRPDLARRLVPTPFFVMESEEGFWDGWGFTEDACFARYYTDAFQCFRVMRELQERGKTVRPVFRQAEERWWAEEAPVPTEPDPWGKALEKTRAVPGCSWVPISPATRERLEHEIMFQYVVRGQPDYKDMLRAAARFGHPLYTVYADFAARQGWDPAFREELARIDLLHARYRTPPGDIPVLQPMVGPSRVVCSPQGFWSGSNWSTLDQAEHYPYLNREFDEAFRSACLRAEELTGVRGVEATIAAHPLPRPTANQEDTREKQKSKKSRKR